MSSNGLGSGESKLETAVSYVLIVGVIVSLALEMAGAVLFYRTFGRLDISQGKAVFIQSHDFFRFLRRLAAGEHPQGGAGILLMTLGIAVLILTPYVRVVASAIYFAWRLDVKFLLITSFVLAVLTVSLALH